MSILSFAHLERMSTPMGLYEHARYDEPRIQHGFCVDDVARGLVVTSREAHAPARVRHLADSYLAFLVLALKDDGRMHNRRSAVGLWIDAPSTDDHWGRALWAFGTAANHTDDISFCTAARAAAAIALLARSPHRRSMAYAALGAGLILDVDPDDEPARSLLIDARDMMGHRRPSWAWPWPEDRLTYANAVLPQAMIVIGTHLHDPDLIGEGLRLLGWLVDVQQNEGHLSLVPSTGRAPGDQPPGFAQQPIEAAALAEACRTAYLATDDSRWLSAIDECWAWFEGLNDIGVVMFDAVTGAGFDGLERGAANQNQGAESTLAWLSTRQIALMPVLAGTP